VNTRKITLVSELRNNTFQLNCRHYFSHSSTPPPSR